MRHTGGMKPIETVYNGYRFRSRLEARWAVFFDTCGVTWEYEPEGFELPNGEKYLPDFRVYNCEERAPETMWIEVKGEMTHDDASKILSFIGRLPRENSTEHSGFIHAYYENAILVVGDIPRGETFEEILVSQKNQWAAYDTRYRKWPISPLTFETIDGDDFCCHLCSGGYGRLAFIGDDSNYFRDALMDRNLDKDLTAKAYRAARQARFEHGELSNRKVYEKL